ncbi:unnamed protein product [Echinostoma caproni]|uniref:SANT domain-containing protein n=1 Tax=Echinostoma caproni TaxID=27848 RepID=A0A183BFJ4_9TREM|nr:unnamed protein product [Echinostoma caproni]
MMNPLFHLYTNQLITYFLKSNSVLPLSHRLSTAAETAQWTTDEILQFQHGLTMYGRDFHLVARTLQANGMNKSVKACVEFYYVWKRMNTPTDVKWSVLCCRFCPTAVCCSPLVCKPLREETLTSTRSFYLRSIEYTKI